MVWDKRFLKTPLWNGDRVKGAWQECCDKIFPYAFFARGRKYGEYYCDLLPVQRAGFSLTEEGRYEIAGVFEAMFARWCIDKKLPRSKQTVVYGNGPTIISIAPCPVGEEAYIHQAMCRIFAKHLRLSGGEIEKIYPQTPQARTDIGDVGD
ncbi:hypothetical protein [Desulfofundulus salinus]|uniref:Uncharacterized protein n=1 Tax=Desulfofundulus salinus TaxID=2419843 RepID=A0A494X2I3_9FIRM|nr:hypothetical protein [Desulfofundulus salinum]RKO67044.1 hypothetical protein D7024_08820 [Desulfofundulus salinum]